MGRLPDLVRDSELETHFSPDCNAETVHTYHERKPRVRGKLAARTEHWRRLRKIGSGGFGSVWLEKCTQPEQHEPKVRAVKQMEIKRWSSHVDYNRELEAIAKFSHRKYERCFVKSFGWYKSEEHLFIAMEYLDLGDLHSYLRDNPALPEKEAREIIFQILDGINLMHDNEFTHRDLKLNNILLKEVPPNDWWVKIADFGISKRIEDGIGLPTVTKGTPGYMAPELLGFIPRGTPYAVDIWAVGEITFQLLTKQPAFESPGRLSNYVQDTSNFIYDPIHATGTTELGIDFIFSTLRPEPDQRISARDALGHRWMDQSLPSAHEPVSKELSAITDTDTMTEQFASWDTITISRPLTTILETNAQRPSTTLSSHCKPGIDPWESSRPSETSTTAHRTKNRRKNIDGFIAQKSDRATSDYSFESNESVISVPGQFPSLHKSRGRTSKRPVQPQNPLAAGAVRAVEAGLRDPPVPSPETSPERSIDNGTTFYERTRGHRWLWDGGLAAPAGKPPNEGARAHMDLEGTESSTSEGQSDESFEYSNRPPEHFPFAPRALRYPVPDPLTEASLRQLDPTPSRCPSSTTNAVYSGSPSRSLEDLPDLPTDYQHPARWPEPPSRADILNPGYGNPISYPISQKRSPKLYEPTRSPRPKSSSKPVKRLRPPLAKVVSPQPPQISLERGEGLRYASSYPRTRKPSPRSTKSTRSPRLPSRSPSRRTKSYYPPSPRPSQAPRGEISESEYASSSSTTPEPPLEPYNYAQPPRHNPSTPCSLYWEVNHDEVADPTSAPLRKIRVEYIRAPRSGRRQSASAF